MVVCLAAGVATWSWLHAADPFHWYGSSASGSAAPFHYVSTKFGYDIEFPGRPTKSSSSAGGVEVETANWSGNGSELTSSAFALAATPADQAGELTGGLKGAFSNIKGAVLTKQTPMTLDGMNALRGDGTRGSEPMVVIIAADGPTVYVLSGLSADAVMGTFVSSFHHK
jgi:hypothetical protein